MHNAEYEGPEEVSILLHRGSRVAKDYDTLRFSKASSSIVLADGESEMQGMHQISQEHLLDRDGRSPMAVRRVTKPISRKQTAVNIRKLTNSLFVENSICGGVVIEEEEKEKDEHD